MNSQQQLSFRLIFKIGQMVTIMIVIMKFSQANAAPLQQFTSPTTITVGMYALRGDGSKDPDFGTTTPNCSSTGVTKFIYGCTYYDGGVIGKSPKKAYPFISDTIIINFEGDTIAPVDSSQQGYLHNVISQEMAEGSPLSSYTAQAIASRTYTYDSTNWGTETIK